MINNIMDILYIFPFIFRHDNIYYQLKNVIWKIRVEFFYNVMLCWRHFCSLDKNVLLIVSRLSGFYIKGISLKMYFSLYLASQVSIS